ncbi:hypothetical protein LY78DRAFT_74277 [Colletotrichum sublineola]|nr:hypothetical protein LY78DRAFT_74277 [Colletotrichum sublineola]
MTKPSRESSCCAFTLRPQSGRFLALLLVNVPHPDVSCPRMTDEEAKQLRIVLLMPHLSDLNLSDGRLRSTCRRPCCSWPTAGVAGCMYVCVCVCVCVPKTLMVVITPVTHGRPRRRRRRPDERGKLQMTLDTLIHAHSHRSRFANVTKRAKTDREGGQNP